MATLPQAADYGARVQLRSSRVDIPGQGEMAVADALSRAATTFTNMAIEHKQKDDALSYSNAKNEYMIADIQEREKLKDDQNFDTHDERYRTAMKGHYERLFPTVRSQRDQHLFDAEARLMDERGSVSVGDNARTKRYDWSVNQFTGHADAARKIILTATDAQTAQNAMFGVLEEATALRDAGIFTPEQYKAVLQGWVQESSFARLVAMNPKDREIALEASITHRKTSGEPITQEQIAEGLGTGSIADFLHLDTAVKMLEETQRANEIDEVLGTAQGIFDAARGRFPTNSGAMMEEIRRLSKEHEDPKVREESVRLGRQYRDEAVGVENDMRDNIMTSATTLISSGEMSFASINPDELSKLLPHQLRALQDHQSLVNENKQFPGETRWTLDPKGGMSYAVFSNMTDEEKMAVNLDTAEWTTVLKRDVWQHLKDTQDVLKSQKPSQRALPGGLTNPQMVTSALVRSGMIPQTGRDIEDSEAYQRLLYEMDRATQAAQEVKGSALTNSERNQILSEVLTPMAFTDDYWSANWVAGWPDKDEEDMVPIAAMSSAQLKTARLPWAAAATEIASTSSTGIGTTYQQELELAAKRLGISPDQDHYERAYFALKYRLGAAEVTRRLQGE